MTEIAGAHRSYREIPIPRQKLLKVNDILKKNKPIEIIPYYHSEVSGLSKIFLKPFAELKTNEKLDNPKIDLLWHAAYFFKRCRLVGIYV